MQTLILFFKGLIIGIGKIIPGVSGSLLAISLGVYEQAIEKIESIWHTKKESILYLFPLGIGILLSLFLGSKIILHFLEKYYTFTVLFFIGLIVGTIPSVVKKQSLKKTDWLIISSIVLFIFYLETTLQLQTYIPENTIFDYLYIIFLGFLDALTTIVPGISGTATFMMLGSYEFILKLFGNPFSNILYCILFGIGLISGVLIMIKVINYCFKKYPSQTWTIILGFLFSSILSLSLKIIDSIKQTNLLPLIILFIIGFKLTSLFDE